MFRRTQALYEADGLPSDSRLRLGAAGRAAAIVVFILAGWIALWSLEPADEASAAGLSGSGREHLRGAPYTIRERSDP